MTKLNQFTYCIDLNRAPGFYLFVYIKSGGSIRVGFNPLGPGFFTTLRALGRDPSSKIAKNTRIDLKIGQHTCFRVNYEFIKNEAILVIFVHFMSPKIFYTLRNLGGGGSGRNPKSGFFCLKLTKMRLLI